MRLPNAAHESRPWRIREIVPDFTLEDVWALPVHGGAEDFQTLLELMASSDPANAESLPTRILWRVRDRLGKGFGLGRISTSIDSGSDDAAGKLPIPGTNETSLTDRRQTICATPRRIWLLTRCLSRPSIGPTSSSPQRCRTRPCTA